MSFAQRVDVTLLSWVNMRKGSALGVRREVERSDGEVTRGVCGQTQDLRGSGQRGSEVVAQ